MRTGGFIFFSVLAMLSLLALGIVNAKEKVTIGAIEEVILLPWGVRLPARIDTGASTTSLDARGLKIQNNIAEFRLPDMYGGLLLSLPVVDWRHIRSALTRHLRPVVEIELCLGPRRLLIKANLHDRSRVKYPLIIGRNALKQGFIVDVRKTNLFPPSCAEGPSQ